MFWHLLVIGYIISGIRGHLFFKHQGKTFANRGLPFREEGLWNNNPILKEYDFIIVGAGPAGSVLANRLTEVSDWKVLLLEAGREGTILNDIPLINQAFILTNYSWGYKAEPQQDVCLGLVGKVCLWPSGKGVGGGSIMNAMLMTRGHPSDYDRWAEEGNPDWSYEQVLPYFRKSEHMVIPELRQSPYHGDKGPVFVNNPYPTKLVDRFLRAGEELGFDIVDYNDKRTPIGFSKSQISTAKGRRYSAASAYLFPIKNRPNFHIAKNSLVTKIIIDPESKQAKGVSFIKNGKERIVYAKKEVILSAGSFNSAQLLMLSGIGHRDHLNEFNIPVLNDLPVGDNLQEHLTTAASIFLINTTDSVLLTKLLNNFLPTIYQWAVYGKGLLANNIAEGLAYINTENNNTRPNIEFIFIPVTFGFDYGLMFRKTLGITDKVFNEALAKTNNKEGWAIGPMLMYPKSRGKVRLRSSDPKDSPRLIANFLSDPDDVRVIVEGIRVAIKLSESKAFQEIGSSLHTDPIPGCETLQFGSDEYWECVLRMIPIQLHHQCCTSKMGPNPESSVVNERLVVHGINGLRVVDASIMPVLTGAHTMSTCYMIGEKAADIIKEDWKK